MKTKSEVISTIKRPAPAPLYGPALLLLLMACGGGGGGGGGRPVASTTDNSQPDGTDAGDNPAPEETATPDQEPTPTTDAGVSVNDISLPNVFWRSRPENIKISKDATLFQPMFNVDVDDESTITLTYRIGGRDAALFHILDPATGAVKFKRDEDPDYETKPDYQFSVIAEGEGLTITLSSITIPVTNLNEGVADIRIPVPDSGTFEAGQKLTATVSGDPDGDPLAKDINWQWQRLDQSQSWTNIGTNSASYTLASADEGHTLRVLVIYTDGGGFVETISQVIVIPAPAPALPSPPDPLPTEITMTAEVPSLPENTSQKTTLATITLTGGHGPDYIRGQGGADIMDGGEGVDILSYRDSPGPVWINLDTGKAGGGNAAGDSFSNFENVYGSGFDDVLIGDGADNLLFGENGHDILVGGPGQDILNGGRGNDLLSGGPGADILVDLGGHDAYVLELAAGSRASDTVVFFLPHWFDTDNGADRIDLYLDQGVPGAEQAHSSLAGLKAAAKIRWTQDTDAGRLSAGSSVLKDNDTTANDTVIFFTHGTADESDDEIVMILEDYADPLALDMFTVILA